MVNTRWQEVSEADILAANIQKYADDKIIDFYANIDELQFPYLEYTVIFNAVLDLLGRGRRIKAVDMCGGAGRASFILKECDPDCDLTLVDCADKMLAVAEQKAEQMDVQDIKIVKQDAFSFLKEAEQFDLIIFSSAIHHFKDPVELLHSASCRLKPGGLIVTIADPTILIKSTRYQFFEFMVATREEKKRRLQKWFYQIWPIKSEKTTALLDDVDIAEYQAITGIDDHSLRRDLQQQGLEPLVHLRYPAGNRMMMHILPLLGLPWAFCMILANQGDTHYNQENKRMLLNEIQHKMPFNCKYF